MAYPRNYLRELLVLFVTSRILVWIVAGLSLAIVTKGRFYVPHPSPIDWFTRWDAGSFLEIADHGYWSPPGARTNFPFLPLYPLMVRAISLGGMVNLAVAAQCLSLISLWVSCVYLWRAVFRDFRNPSAATLAVTFLLFGPVSFFFSSAYSEALFLALTLGCFDALIRRRLWLAGIFAALATLTRFAGIVLVVPLLWQAFEAAWERKRSLIPDLMSVAVCAAPAGGFAMYCAFLWWRYGDALLYFHSEQMYWGRHFAWFWLFLSHESFSGLASFYQVWFATALLVAIGLLLSGVLFRLRISYLLYTLALIFLYISSRLAEALPRYLSVAFPLYIAAALVASKWPRMAVPLIATSAALEALAIVLFVNGYWFT